jgi:ribosomal protein L32
MRSKKLSKAGNIGQEKTSKDKREKGREERVKMTCKQAAKKQKSKEESVPATICWRIASQGSFKSF